MKSITSQVKAFGLLKSNRKFEGLQQDQVCIQVMTGCYEKIELKSGKTEGRKTSYDLIVVMQGKEDGSLYQGIASMDGIQEVEVAGLGD